MGEAVIRLSRPQEYICLSPKKINLFLGGVGSGKTHLAGIVSAYFVTNFPKARGFIGANTYGQLNLSTMLRVREVWKDYFGMTEGEHYVVGKQPLEGWSKDGHNFDSYSGVISFPNGAVIFVGSLDNAKAHDGKQFAWAMLDETKDTREQDVKEVILRGLRQSAMGFDGNRLVETDGRNAHTPLYILTSPAKVQWLNEWFELDSYRAAIESHIYSKTDFFKAQFADKCVAISSTFHNDHNLPQGYIEGMLANNSEERGRALVYANPFSRTGGEFYSGFSAARHIGRAEFTPGIPVHITFDQNVVPYITACLWQVENVGDKWELRQFDEFCLPNPNNTTERLCEAIVAKWGGRMDSVFFYGDASGHKSDTRANVTDYEIVERVLRRWLNNGSDRTQRRNPPVLQRRDFINNMLEGKTAYRILIDEGCKNSIVDLTYVKQDKNGLKWKETAKDDVTGQTFEKYGHCFEGNTLIATRTGQRQIKDIEPGDYVLTRAGFKRVLRKFDNGIRGIADFELNGKTISCTPEHLFFTEENGFVEARNLVIGSTICTFDENKGEICKKKLLSLKVLSLPDTRTPNAEASSSIFQDGSNGRARQKKSVCTALFGCAQMGKFRKGFTFITKTATRLTTLWKTLLAFRAKNTITNIGRSQTKKENPLFCKFSMRRQGLWRQNGINQTRVGLGIGNTQKGLLRQIQGKSFALNVEVSELANTQNLVFAPFAAKTGIICEMTGRRGHTTKQGFAANVEKGLPFTNGAKQETAPELAGLRKGQVYDLEVEGEHEYFANGFLVHNCSDSLDYFLTTIAANDFERFQNL